MKTVSIPTNKGIKKVAAEEIIRIEASSSYCKIFFANDRPLTVAKVLQWFELNLPYEYFYRVHRGHIVNRLFISAISEDCKLTLLNGEQLQVSRRKRKAVSKMTVMRA
jgi:two-component system LytT family response regulator